MKRIALFAVLAAVGIFSPAAHAQNHGEVGVFVDYFRLHDTGTNFAGLGARAAFNVKPAIQFEAEMAYDFNKVFTERFTSGTGTVSAQSSNLKVLHGLFGPKLQTTGPVRLFVTAKGGFVNFRFDPRPATFGTFTSSVDGLRTNDVSGVFYPGGGVEAYLGPIGLRFEVGDEMIFNHGAHHNWKASFGPQLRF